MAEAIAAVRDGFIGLARGDFEVPVRTALCDGRFLVMSVHHRPTATAMVKTLSLNFEGRVPAIDGTVVWSDLAGTDHLVADAAAVTTLRTGAASGVATDLLAPPNASHCLLIGAGAQAADQARAMYAVRPLQRLTIVGRSAGRAQALANQLAEELPRVSVVVGTDVRDVLGDADLVCCATTSTEPLFELEQLRPEVHINAIGSYRPTMRELPDPILADATVYVDEVEPVLQESGEVIHAIAAGALAESELTEIGAALLSGAAATGRTVFKSVGVAVQDWAVAQLLARD
ncbi:ornithine cyclodeaminase family protein [Leekyejoonella antrihumi]|uniref:Ornithine cyclodeaminase family protein n=2 Tax=Leekyejoonella antrihumi TaxID=1660198 RepID=A0A563DW24_9MICO|nr:ornithine cyclodeaminase family protein [Leekyejoonella antrihumi]